MRDTFEVHKMLVKLRVSLEQDKSKTLKNGGHFGLKLHSPALSRLCRNAYIEAPKAGLNKMGRSFRAFVFHVNYERDASDSNAAPTDAPSVTQIFLPSAQTVAPISLST